MPHDTNLHEFYCYLKTIKLYRYKGRTHCTLHLFLLYTIVKFICSAHRSEAIFHFLPSIPLSIREFSVKLLKMYSFHHCVSLFKYGEIVTQVPLCVKNRNSYHIYSSFIIHLTFPLIKSIILSLLYVYLGLYV